MCRSLRRGRPRPPVMSGKRCWTRLHCESESGKGSILKPETNWTGKWELQITQISENRAARLNDHARPTQCRGRQPARGQRKNVKRRHASAGDPDHRPVVYLSGSVFSANRTPAIRFRSCDEYQSCRQRCSSRPPSAVHTPAPDSLRHGSIHNRLERRVWSPWTGCNRHR